MLLKSINCSKDEPERVVLQVRRLKLSGSRSKLLSTDRKRKVENYFLLVFYRFFLL